MAMTRERVARDAVQGDFSEKNLQGLDLSGIEFRQAEFTEANLKGVNFAQSKFSQCEFNESKLAGANLQGASFDQCEFEAVDLSKVNAKGARFVRCTLPAEAAGPLAGATFKDCHTDDDAEFVGVDASLAPAAGATQTQASEWKQFFKKFDEWDDDERQYKALEALAGAIAQQGLGSPQAFRKVNDGKVELRAVASNHPVRIELGLDGMVVLDMQAIGRPDLSGTLVNVCYEPTFVPEPDVGAWADGDTVRVFLGKGVYLEGHVGVTYIGGTNIIAAGGIDQMLQILSQMPTPFVAELTAAMQTENIRSLIAYNQNIWCDPHHEIPQMYDASVSIARIVSLMDRLGHTLEAIVSRIPADRGLPRGGAKPTGRCRHCAAVYLISETGRCPNCGAPTS